MADNIKIVGEILNIQEAPRYNDDDLRLLSPVLIKEDFGKPNDYIEYYVYDIDDNLLNINYDYKNFKLPSTSYIDPVNGSLPIIEIDPVKDLQNLGYSSGEFRVQYNFFNNIISDSTQQGLFLKEISEDRTEIKLGSTTLTNEQLESSFQSIVNSYSGSIYFVDYIINFGDNIQSIAVNTALNKLESGYELLFKLYEPLPDNISEKVTLWVTKEKVNPYIFEINLDRLVLPPPVVNLRGPNFAIEVPNQNNVATPYQNYNVLVDSINNISTTSYQQFLSLFTSQSIDINTNYTNFNNFVFFSSAKKRIINFYNKIKEIEDYNTFITIYTPFISTTASLQTSINKATASINDIIANFDGFEYYLYFESGSTLTSSIEYSITPYPKSGSATLPYTLYSTASNSASIWFDWATGSAENYDDVNQNKLTFTVPTFIKDDENNEPYLNFLDMTGHYFDNIWVFLQAITDINLANNNLEKGVSKDLVYNVLESLGIKLYNQYGNTDNVNFLVGSSGSANFDNNFTYTGSYLNALPRKDLLAESYKRIYHNLPLLLKTKGTSYGLQTLVSTFGVSSSILPVKEYGGNLKIDTLKEYNDDKVRIISSSIVTGSVLSPYISVLEYPTSSQFRTNDMNYVDISFSPQDKINEFISSSISISNPTWSIDDYIGDPRYQYSSSYENLENQRQVYLSPLSASQLPFTASLGSGSLAATDYNSFIRLIQFFDNSLFKMLQDYVPMRTSLSTGVTISSPILERNKWSYANPSSTSDIEIETGSIAGVSISSEYTDLYDYLTGSKVEYYDGNITGSEINVYSYFASNSFNPYSIPTASLSAGAIYYFEHTDFNVLLNNVSKSLQSSNRRLLEPIYVINSPIRLAGYITRSFAELQDSYETLKTHQLSRYDGVKLSSLKYNNYTSASATYDGDISYGKTAVIDKNVVKLGLFSEVVANRFLPKRNNVVLKYLVDINGNLTELNLRNTHWEEVQNTFIMGDTASISLFNTQLFGNQKTTDGKKLIFDSGYNYSPILYFASCSGDPDISFQNQGNPSAYLATAQNVSSSYFISGSTTLGYPLQGGYVLNLFNSPIETSTTYWTNATTTTPATYSVQETGQYKVYANLQITTEMLPNNSATWSLEMYSSSVKIQEVIQPLFFGNLSSNCTEYTITNNNPDVGVEFTYTRCVDGVIVPSTIPPARSGPTSKVVCSRDYPNIDPIYEGDTEVTTGTTCGTYSIPGSTIQTINLTINNGYIGNTNYSNFLKNDQISFKLKLVNASSNNITASLATGDNGFLSIGSLAVSTGYSLVKCGYVSSASVADSSFSFTSSLSSFYGESYFFSPNPTSGSKNSLYELYGDIDYPFVPKSYDLLVLYLSDDTILEYTILGVALNNGLLTLTLNAPLSNLAKANLANSSYKRFLLLSKVKDETNVIVNFTKRPGKTSYGFLISDNISSNVLNNIDNITREVKQKLINEQPIIDSVDGGSFG